MFGRDRLNQTEQYLAYLIGFGIALSILAVLLASLGIVDNTDYTISLLLVGLAIVILGVGAWLILQRPWEKADDISKPADAVPQPPAAAPKAEKAAAPIVKAAAEAAPVAAEVPAAAPVVKAAVEAVPAAAEVPAAAPVVKAAAAQDDLTLIEGIGPKTAAALNAAGITSYAQIAELTPEALVETAQAQGARVSKADTWPEQARLAMGGEVSALVDKKARIKGGEQHDDLTQIEGIGPKTQSVLHAAGIHTFQALADATPESLRETLTAAGLKSMAPDTWPEQAGYIVRGDLAGLQTLQDSMKGGRR
ncbi:MAG: DUF4332 domain-containing protein [Anaerolineae bacterium]|nr:DUF4332 domain-containing protein [Anaerolineae bacterium]